MGNNCDLLIADLLLFGDYDIVYERDGINYFWSIKNSNDVLNKFKSKTFRLLNCLYMIFLHCILRYLIILLKINLLI